MRNLPTPSRLLADVLAALTLTIAPAVSPARSGPDFAGVCDLRHTHFDPDPFIFEYGTLTE